jgi:hypothetical protein
MNVVAIVKAKSEKKAKLAYAKVLKEEVIDEYDSIEKALASVEDNYIITEHYSGIIKAD